jgi:SAM-dependent methyltransferase
VGTDLRKLERIWRNLGRDDPFWAALTLSDKRQGGWSSDEFFRTGDAEIHAALQIADRRGWTVKRRRALDFGCGAGRLTQALAARFDRVDGVDISGPMIAAARQHNRFGQRCQYHHRVASDLNVFRDGVFDFIYSVVTLQHVPPEYSQKYIGEFIRVLAPNGLLMFQLPSHRAPIEPAMPAGGTVSAGRLPPDAFAAVIALETDVGTWLAGETRLLHVSVRNDGSQSWPAGSRDDGLFRIQIGNRWRAVDGAMVVANDGRTGLPHDVVPGECVTVFLEATAPLVNGFYVLDIDMVQEHVAWFQERGSPPFQSTCRVSGGHAPSPPGPALRRFGRRFPRLRGVLVSVGLDAIRGGIRRYRERARTGRYQRAAMVMHCVRRADVVALIETLGAEVLDVEQERTRDGFQSCRYWVAKRRSAAVSPSCRR